MQPVYQAVLRSWSIPPAATFALALTELVYLRGWWLLRRAGLPYIPRWRAVSFLSGLASLFVALASPLDTFSGFVLTAHMMQHMLLMMVAPPLILLGAPLIPLVRGLPIFAAREFAGPFLNWQVAKRTGRALTNPIVALLLMGAVMFAWHTPRLYELALGAASWHEVEHACFFIASLIFWWPVVQPWPSHAQSSRWAMVPYLLVADLQNTALSAILVFSDRVIYQSYTSTPRLFGFSAQDDQVAAGAIMWLVGSLAFILPAIAIAVQCLSKKPYSADSSAARRREIPALDRPIAAPERASFFHRFIHWEFRGKSAEAISFAILFVAAGSCFVGLSASSAGSDDQVLRSKQASEPFAVAILAAPGDFETGPVPVSVLVQDRATQNTLLDATVDLAASPADHAKLLSSPVRATFGRSDNKLLQAADVRFPGDGAWILNVAVYDNSEEANFSLPLRVVMG